MLIEKEVFNKINTVNKNLQKLAKHRSNKNPYISDNKGSTLIHILVEDLAYIVGKLNETYEAFSAILSQEIDKKD